MLDPMHDQPITSARPPYPPRVPHRRRLPEAARVLAVLASVLTALVPLSLVIHGPLKAIPPALLFLLGTWWVIRRHEVRRGYLAAWPVVASACLMMAWLLASTLAHGLGMNTLDGGAHILLYTLVAAVFVCRLDMRVLWCGFSVTAAAFGLLCIVQHFGLHLGRAYVFDGRTSTAIEFATIMLGLASLALVQLLRAHLSRGEQVVHLAGLLLGAYGALLTQSRGPLLAFVPVFVLLLVLRCRLSGHWRWLLGGAGAFVLFAVVAMASLHGSMLQRFSAINQQIAVASTGKVDGSVSARLAMWHTAGRAFVEHPVVGLGFDGYQPYARAEVEAGRSDPAVARYNNPHNMYLGAAVNGGIPGLLVLLVMFVAPLLFFARHAHSRCTDVATAAWSGLAVVVLYMLCAMTDSVFYRIMTQSFYYFLVLGLALRIGYARLRNVAPQRPGTLAGEPEGPNT